MMPVYTYAAQLANADRDVDELIDFQCAVGERCPSCLHHESHAIPISVTMDLQDNILFRCEACGHEWENSYEGKR